MTGEFRHVFTFSLNRWKKSTRSALSKCCRPSATLFTCHFYFVWPMESKEKPEQKCFLVNCLPCSSETSVGGYESVAFGLQSSTTADVSLQTTRGHVSLQSADRATLFLLLELFVVKMFQNSMHQLQIFVSWCCRPVPSSERQRTAVPSQSHLSVK